MNLRTDEREATKTAIGKTYATLFGTGVCRRR